MLPALLAVLPGLVAGLAGARDGVGAPELLAGVEVGRRRYSRGCRTRRRQRPTIARSRTTSGAMVSVSPSAGSAILRSHTFSPVALLMREHAAVERNRDDLVLPQRDAAIVDAAAGDVAGPGLVGAGIELPPEGALLAARHVDRIDRAPAVRHVHDAVLDERGGFEIAELVAGAAALEAAQRDRERELQVLDGVGVDLLELREAMALVVAVVKHPVLRLLVDVERALEGHVGRPPGRERGGGQERAHQGPGQGPGK